MVKITVSGPDGMDFEAIVPWLRIENLGEGRVAIFTSEADAELFVRAKEFHDGSVDYFDAFPQEVKTDMTGATTPAQILIDLNADGSLVIHNQGAMEIWCDLHKKLVTITLTDQSADAKPCCIRCGKPGELFRGEWAFCKEHWPVVELNFTEYARQHMPKSPVADLVSLEEASTKLYHKLLQASKDQDVQPDVVLGGENPATFRATPIQYVDKLAGDDDLPILSKNWSAIGGSFIWNDRMVKVDDGLLWLSAKGRLDDFEINASDLPYGTEAMALNAGVPVLSAERVDDRNLRFTNGVLVDHKGESNHRDFTVDMDVDLTLVFKNKRLSGELKLG